MINRSTTKTAVNFVFLFFLSLSVRSQTPGLGTWTVVNAKENFTNKWNGFIEGQVRTQKFYYDFYYYELKAGIGYNLNQNLQFIYGIGKMETYQYEGNFESPLRGNEFRMWEQINLQQSLGNVKLQHGYRIEQRFSGGVYRNRFRYRLNANIPVSKTRLFLNFYDEIFLSDKKPYFERNREYGGVGYKLSHLLTGQIGYIHQYDFNKDINPYTKDAVQTSLIFDLNALKHEVSKL